MIDSLPLSRLTKKKRQFFDEFSCYFLVFALQSIRMLTLCRRHAHLTLKRMAFVRTDDLRWWWMPMVLRAAPKHANLLKFKVLDYKLR